MPGNQKNNGISKRRSNNVPSLSRDLSSSDASLPDALGVTNPYASLHFSQQESRDALFEKNAPKKSGKDAQSSSLTGLVAAVTHATLPSWTNMILMVTLIFGGCCANVFALEAIIKHQPSAGPLITFAQFALTALFTLPSFLSFTAGPRSFFLNPRVIPLKSWLAYTGFFVTINLLNNWAFAYKISVPLHIIVRSGGPVASIIIGYLFNGKRYSGIQIVAVSMLTLGVVGAALADAAAKGQSIAITSGTDDSSTTLMTSIVGFSILALAMILSAFQGIYADRLYETYGRGNWKEALFYSHVLSLPFLLPTYPQISSQLRMFLSSPPLLSKLPSSSPDAFGASVPASMSVLLRGKNLIVGSILGHIPIQVVYLLINALTQYLCIRGVHLLSAKSSSLTVTIVLNIRKLVSLLLSIYLFGNELASGILVGAVLVFAGGGLYGVESARLRKKKKD